jgi:DNA-binding MarR family transcriptional regulator
MMEDVEIVEGPLIGTLLRIPSSVVAEATERGLAAAGYEDVRAAYLPVLQPLFTRPEGARITDLAAWAHVTKPAMVYLVNHLEAHGYVERTADPMDGRAQRVRITERGAAAIHCVHALVQQTEADWAARIGATQLAELKRILRSLIASFEEHGEAMSKDQ